MFQLNMKIAVRPVLNAQTKINAQYAQMDNLNWPMECANFVLPKCTSTLKTLVNVNTKLL